MILSGKTYQWDEILPFAKIVVVDSSGVIKQPTNGVVSDIDGNYKITVSASDYLRVTGAGMRDKRIKVSEVCKQNSCNFDIVMEGSYKDEVEVTVVGKRPTKTYKKPSWAKYMLIAGASLIGVAAIVYGISKMKK
jgi:hypothetical protein